MPINPNQFGPDRPYGWHCEASLDGGVTFTDMTPFTTRNQGVTINRQGAEEPITMNIPLWSLNGGFPTEPVLPDFAPIHVWDPYMNVGGSGLFVRYFNGIVLNQRPNLNANDDGNANEVITLECVSIDWLLDNPPSRPQAKVHVGAAAIWLPSHSYYVNDIVTASPDVGRQYVCTQSGTGGHQGVSGTTQPAFDGNPGVTGIPDGTGVTQLLWAEFGDSAISDLAVWGTLLPIYYPLGEITYNTSGTGNMKRLIGSVEGFDVDASMTLRDVAKKLVAQVGNSGYSASYSARAASTTYVVGDLIEESPSVHGVIWQCTTPGTTSSGGTPGALISTNALGVTAHDGTVIWTSYKFTGKWEPSCTYNYTQRIEPDPKNGSWYQCVTAGTTLSTMGTWSSTPGVIISNGTAQFRCMGPTSIAPVLQLWTAADNAGHTATWKGDLAWFDSNSGVVAVTPEYSDVIIQDANHIHYTSMTLNREGSNDYANRWYVAGKNDSFAVVDNISEQRALGIVVSKYYSDTSDTGPATDPECYDVGSNLLGVSIVRESVQVTAPDITDPVLIQRLSTCNVTAALLGLGSQTYPATAVSVTLSQDAPKWEITFGSGFLTDRQDPYSNVRSSRIFGSDLTPPNLVVWPSGFLRGNSIDPQSRTVTVTAIFTEDSRDTFLFQGFYQIHGVDHGVYIPSIHYPTTVVQIPGLPVGVTMNIYLAAFDHEFNVKRDPFGNIIFSVSPDITTASLPTRPIAPDIGTVTQSHDSAGYHIFVPVVNTSGSDATEGGNLQVRVGPIARNYAIPPGATFPYTVTVDAVTVGTTYQLSARIIDSYFQPSLLTSPEVPYTVTLGSTAAVTSLALDTRDGSAGYGSSANNFDIQNAATGWIRLRYTLSASEPVDYYLAESYYLDGSGFVQDYRLTQVPAGQDRFSLTGLVLGVQYTFNVTAVKLGIYSTPANFLWTITPWVYQRQDSGTSFAVDYTHINFGSYSYNLLSGSLGGTVKIHNTRIPAHEGSWWAWQFQVEAGSATGTVTYELECYDSLGALIGGAPISLYSGTPTTSFVSHSDQVQLPVGTFKIASRLGYAKSSGIPVSAYFGEPRLAPSVTAPELGPLAVTVDKINLTPILSAPLYLYDESGVPAFILYWSPGAAKYVLTPLATDPTYPSPGLTLKGGTVSPTDIDLDDAGMHITGDVLMGNHLVANNASTPSAAGGAGAGTGPTITVVGEDKAGTITLVVGTGPTGSSTILTVTFASVYGAAPKVVIISPANSLTASLSGALAVYVDPTNTTTAHWLLSAGGSALTATKTYKWFYWVIG